MYAVPEMTAIDESEDYHLKKKQNLTNKTNEYESIIYN